MSEITHTTLQIETALRETTKVYTAFITESIIPNTIEITPMDAGIAVIDGSPTRPIPQRRGEPLQVP